MKFCVICWEEVHLDGLAYYCKNCSKDLCMNDISKIVWLDGRLVFDTEIANLVTHYDEPGVSINEI